MGWVPGLHGRTLTRLREGEAMADDLRGVAPVEHLPQDAGKKPQKASALPLGRRLRAMLFHVGALWRLNELGYLLNEPGLQRLGGSITAGVLVMDWPGLGFDGAEVGKNFEEKLVKPIRLLASVTIAQWAIGIGILTPNWAST
jgi:NTE family protein